MAAGTAPIYVTTPQSAGVAVTAANVKNDGTGAGIGTDIFKLYTAGSNGAWIGRIRFIPSASTASTATTATVGRVYFSSQSSGATTNANTYRLDEVAIPAQTVDTTTTQLGFFEVVINSFLAASQTVLVSTHHAPAANTTIHAVLLGSGDY